MFNRFNYKDLYRYLTSKYDDVVLGTQLKVKGETVSIAHESSEAEYSDDEPILVSSTYRLVFFTKRPAFTDINTIALLDDGIRFVRWDDTLKMNIFTGLITLYGPGGVPHDEK